MTYLSKLDPLNMRSDSTVPIMQVLVNYEVETTTSDLQAKKLLKKHKTMILRINVYCFCNMCGAE